MIQLHKVGIVPNMVINEIVSDANRRKLGNSASAKGALEDYRKQFEDNLSQNKIKTAAISLRFFSELFVKEYCAANDVDCEGLDACEKIDLLSSKGLISKEMADSLHTLRKIGNSGAHDEKSAELDSLPSNGDHLRYILQTLVNEYDSRFDTHLHVAKEIFRDLLGSMLQIHDTTKIILETGLNGCYYDKERDTQVVACLLAFQGFPSAVLVANYKVSNFNSSKIQISEIRITTCDKKILVLSTGEDAKQSLWAKETKLQAALYPTYRANDPCQDMTESYYEKKYFSSDEFNMLYALIDIIATIPNQALPFLEKKVLINKDGFKVLKKSQNKELIELQRMSQTFAAISTLLCSTLKENEAEKMKDELYPIYNYWNDIVIFGSICKECENGFEEKDFFFESETPVVLVSTFFDKLGFHLGYKFVSAKEQYIILMSRANVPINSFKITKNERSFLYPCFDDMKSPNIDFIFSTKFDYDAFFKECMEQGFEISATTRKNRKGIKDFKSCKVVTSRDRKRRRIRRAIIVIILILGYVLYGLVHDKMKEREREARQKNEEFKAQIAADLKKAEDAELQKYKEMFISSPEEALTYVDELLVESNAYFEADDISKMLCEEYEKKEGTTQYSYKVLGYYFLQRKEIDYDVSNNRFGIVYEQSVTKPSKDFGPVYKVYEFDNLRIEDGVFTYDVVGACDKYNFSNSLSRTGVGYYYNSNMVGHALVFTNSKYGTNTCIYEKHIDVELSRGETDIWMSDDLLEHQGDWWTE